MRDRPRLGPIQTVARLALIGAIVIVAAGAFEFVRRDGVFESMASWRKPAA